MNITTTDYNDTLILTHPNNSMIGETSKAVIVDNSLVSEDLLPEFCSDFNAIFGTDLKFIDHNKIGQVVPLETNEHQSTFKVEKPMKAQGGNMVYEVAGMRMVIIKQPAEQEGGEEKVLHKLELFSVQKRYKDFETLRQVLVERWPGFFIPSIPPTKAIVSCPHFSDIDSRGTWVPSLCTCVR